MAQWSTRHFLLLVCSLVFATGVFLLVQGQILFPADFLGWYFPFRGHPQYATGSGILLNTFYQDVPFYFFPFWAFAGEMISQGVLPFWSPLEGAGFPAASAHVQGFFFPLRWLTYGLFQPLVAWHVELACQFLTASISAYLLFRRWSGSNKAATLVALSWTLACGLGPYFQQGGPAWPMALFPCLLLALDITPERPRIGLVATAMFMGLTLVIGHLQYSAPVTAIAFVYALAKSHYRWRKASALVLGIALATPHLVPLIELLVLSRRPPLSESSLLSNLLASREYLGFVFPFFNGAPGDGFYLGRTMANLVNNGREHSLFVGQLVFILAIVGAFQTRRRLEKVGLGLLLLGYLTAGAPLLFQAFATVFPPLWYVTPLRYLPFLHFGLCYFACLGWVKMESRPLNRSEGMLVGGVLGGTVLASLFFIIPATLQTHGFLTWLIELARGGVTKPPYYEGSFGAVITEKILYHFHPTSPDIWLPILLLSLGLVGLKLNSPSRRFAVTLAVLTVDLCFYFFVFNRPVDEKKFYPQLPEIMALKEHHQLTPSRDQIPSRVMSLERGMHPNILLAYGIASFESYASVHPHDFRKLYEPLNAEQDLPHQLGKLVTPERLTPGLLDLFGVSTLYNHPPQELRHTEVPQLAVSPYRPTALRAFVSNRWRVLESEAEIYQPDFNPRESVLLQNPIGFESAQEEPYFQELAEPEFYGCNLVRFRFQNPTPSLLVLTDLFYPGWTAKVNGKAVPIHKAYGFARAVEVPEGEVEVEFLFRPTGWLASLIAVGVSLLLLGFLVFSVANVDKGPSRARAG
jgi:hypothetical protein